MIYDAREFARLRLGVLGLSALAWIALLSDPGASLGCLVPGSSASWPLLLAAHPPAGLARGWLLMLVAMMSPTLVSPIYHILLGSFARRRVRSVTGFAVGYGVVWVAGGALLLAVKLAVEALAPQSWLPAAGVGLGALIWQVSPGKQICLNRCHQHRPFAVFGFAADRDLFCLGVEHGLWCAGSCCALMLFPLLLPQGHLVAMAAVCALMFCERLDPPRTPTWAWRGFGTAACLLNARLRGSAGEPAPFGLRS